MLPSGIINSYLKISCFVTIERLRRIIKSFSEEEIVRLQTGRQKTIIYLLGDLNQMKEDKDYFTEICAGMNIPLEINHVKQKVILGKINDR